MNVPGAMLEVMSWTRVSFSMLLMMRKLVVLYQGSSVVAEQYTQVYCPSQMVLDGCKPSQVDVSIIVEWRYRAIYEWFFCVPCSLNTGASLLYQYWYA